MKSWQKIFTTRNQAEASIIQGMLEENNVPVQIMNKQDSSYVNFGDFDLFVPAHLLETGKQLIAQTLLN